MYCDWLSIRSCVCLLEPYSNLWLPILVLFPLLSFSYITTEITRSDSSFSTHLLRYLTTLFQHSCYDIKCLYVRSGFLVHDKQLANMNDDTELMNSLLGWKYKVESDWVFLCSKTTTFQNESFLNVINSHVIFFS